MANTVSQFLKAATLSAAIALGAHDACAQPQQPDSLKNISSEHVIGKSDTSKNDTTMAVKKDTAATAMNTKKDTAATAPTTTYYPTADAIRNALRVMKSIAPSSRVDSLDREFARNPNAFSYLRLTSEGKRVTLDLVVDSVAVNSVPAASVKKILDASSVYYLTSGRFVPVLTKGNKLVEMTYDNKRYVVFMQSSQKNNTGVFAKFGKSDQNTWMSTRLPHIASVTGNDTLVLKDVAIATFATLQDKNAKGKPAGYALTPDMLGTPLSATGAVEDIMAYSLKDANGKSLGKRRSSDKSSLPGHLTIYGPDRILVPEKAAINSLAGLKSQQEFNKSTSVIIEYVAEAHKDTVSAKRALPAYAVIGDASILAELARMDSLQRAQERKSLAQAYNDSAAHSVAAAGQSEQEASSAPSFSFPNGFGIRIGAVLIPAGNEVVLSAGRYSYSGKTLPAIGIDGAIKPFLPYGIGLKGGIDVAYGKDIAAISEDLGDMSGFTGNAYGSFTGALVKMHLEATKDVMKRLRVSFGVGATSYVGLIETGVNLYDFAGNQVDAPRGARDGSVFNKMTLFPTFGLEYALGNAFSVPVILFSDLRQEFKGSAHIKDPGIESMVGLKIGL